MTTPTSVPLDFESVRDSESESWERSDPARALIGDLNRYGWAVTLRGGSVHHVALARERGAWVGWCDCDGYYYNDEGVPCAHLCAVRRAHWCAERGYRGGLDVDEEPVVVPEVEDANDELPTSPGASRARADGGRDRDVVEPPTDYGPEPRWTGR